MIKTKNDTLNISSLYRFKLCRIFTVFSIIFSAATFSFAGGPKKSKPPVTVKVTVDKRSVTIGDKIKYTVTVSTDKHMEVELFDFGKNLDNFTIKDFGSDKKMSLREQKITAWYLLDTYATGKLIIPKETIKYRKKGQPQWDGIDVEQQEIEVKSLLEKEGPGADLEDIEGLVNLPSKSRPYFILVTLVATVLLTVWAVFSLRNKLSKRSLLLKSAHEIAYEQLSALKKKNLVAHDRIQEFYYEISDITRHYVENRFQIRAPDMTTEEFLIKVKDYHLLKPEHKTLLREFLSYCDLVKFARYTPVPQEIDSTFESAERFIDQTKLEIEQK